MSTHVDPHGLSCAEAVEVVTDYLEGAVPSATAESFELHLVVCPGCRTYLRTMRSSIAVTGTAGGDGPAPEVRAQLLTALGKRRLGR